MWYDNAHDSLRFPEQIHYIHDSMLAAQQAHPAKRVLYSGTHPSHYRGFAAASGDKPVKRSWTPDVCNRTWAPPVPWTNVLAFGVIGPDLPIVDAYELLKSAGELHSLDMKGTADWCAVILLFLLLLFARLPLTKGACLPPLQPPLVLFVAALWHAVGSNHLITWRTFKHRDCSPGLRFSRGLIGETEGGNKTGWPDIVSKDPSAESDSATTRNK